MSDQNRKLYEELGDLARYIEQTMHGFQNLQQPIEAASHQLPQATEHLSDLRKMSEEATHNVMGQTEAIQDNHGRLLTALNGIPITDQTDLTAQVRALAGGAEAELTFTRDGDSQTVTVTLGAFEG